MTNFQQKDSKYIWHPYTQMKDCEINPPVFIEKAKGIKFYDNTGKFYYDTISSWWCNVHGHNHPKIQKAIKTQIKKLDHILFAGFTHEPAINLAEKLIQITPKHITKVFYSDNGSTAVEVALKMSLQYWVNKGLKGKNKFVSLDHGYHGDTIGTMSVSSIGLFNEVFTPLLFKSYKAKTPYCYRCPMNKSSENCNFECTADIENILKKNSDQISAIILEPLIVGSGGMIIYPKEYLTKVAELAKKYNVHLILDEVATGFGRTGKMFASDYVDIQYDFMCISKGLTSGTLPLAVTLMTDEIYNAFYDDYSNKKTFYHGHTYTANPIACAVASASIDIFQDENVLEKIKPQIELLNQGLTAMKDLKLVGDIRTLGMVGAIELVKDKATKKTFSFNERIGYKIAQEALKNNLILRPLGNIVYLYLPLCTTQNDLKKILKKTHQLIKKLQ
jgi:adenosylmethionine-8-amino-7-oxononanoate aminotransferase